MMIYTEDIMVNQLEIRGHNLHTDSDNTLDSCQLTDIATNTYGFKSRLDSHTETLLFEGNFEDDIENCYKVLKGIHSDNNMVILIVNDPDNEGIVIEDWSIIEDNGISLSNGISIPNDLETSWVYKLPLHIITNLINQLGTLYPIIIDAKTNNQIQ